jgi:HAD superfamily hydrolase (TIGR01509 family)
MLMKETEDMFVEILDDRLAMMPGAAELLIALDVAQIPKAIATSSGRRFTRNVLGRFHLEPRFEFILTGEDVTHGKPDPEIYRRAAERFGIEARQMVVLEDSQNGCRAAVASGAFAVAVPSGASRPQDFSGAALVADTLKDRRIYEALGLSRAEDHQ